jgi:hypothetical protein
MSGASEGTTEVSVQPLRDVTTILGSLALVGTLALLSPGVRAVRADASAPPSESSLDADGPTCEAGAVTGGEEVVEYLRHLQRLQLEQMASSPDVADGAGFVVLNNRGYNYGPGGEAVPRAIEFESR